ncbi:hypothetical protein Kpol_1023p32 [Vanderwaltozyma polyspora DSM 70294]|uniref:DNA repair protein RAD5 n=1 Tax=Vanderwaltozyma polyspora (strain ATCC 22028 / DSM 70294 / BCRC 21397 / CBS 2163 / NBRC 10782 / NRRL Y-8283 / UCD 57-17) TaxID=436907 RepID=A7TFQ5_VANPO|nr:uncharacterized protein Kpol_1023p32 [Vanderwaltozyma polyspora DSM 70294]EDO18863.1 hypothetical protein Kpol_1023p32 [Vanderwaltozyma polyspora DSM 70294]
MTTDASSQESKKRFFKDGLDSQEDSSELNLAFDNNDSILFGNRSFKNEVKIIPIDQEDNIAIDDLDENQRSTQNGFDRDEFLLQLQVIIPDIKRTEANMLYDMFKLDDNCIEKAIEYYFEISSKMDKGKVDNNMENDNDDGGEDVIILASSSSPDTSMKSSQQSQKISFGSVTSKKRLSSFEVFSQKKPKLEVRWKRFIGSLQVNAMATRPTTKPLKYGTKLKLVKPNSNVIPSKLYSDSGKKKKALSSYIKVFDMSNNREIGKIPEDIAQIIYPLLEKQEISFLLTLVYCDNKRLSIGDTFVLQLDCFLTNLIFDDEIISTSSSQENISSEFDKSSQDHIENQLEIENRASRLSHLALFKKLNLFPIIDEQKELKKIEELNDTVRDVIDLDDEIIYDNSNEIPMEEEGDKENVDHSLNLNQLMAFYNVTQSGNSLLNLPETQPSKDIFKLELRRYQKQGLSWMLLREQEYDKVSKYEYDSDKNATTMNPLWKQFKWPNDMSWDGQRNKESNSNYPDGLFFYANIHSGKYSMEKPTLKSLVKGGILSDEMGLGKTISTLATIFSAPFDREEKNHNELFIKERTTNNSFDSEIICKPYAYRTTLVVVPTSLLMQWSSEFEKSKNGDDIYSEIYYGGNVTSLKSLLTKTKNPPTAVFTTYGIVQNEWTRISKNTSNNSEALSGLFSVQFFRIVLDEGHIIRNRSTITSKAIMNLSSKRKWILTGTPIINRLDDIYSLVKFLGLEPWSQIGYWKSFVSEPFEKKDFKSAFDVVNSILSPVLLRRTKQMKDIDGKPLVELPLKEIFIEDIELSALQNKVYKYFLDRAESSVREGLAHGDLLKKYSTILVHILRLRQICCDVRLLGTKDDNDEDVNSNNQVVSDSVDVNKILKDLKHTTRNALNQDEITELSDKIQLKYFENGKLKSNECPICTTEPIDANNIIFTECGHCFCESCLQEYFDFQVQKKLETKCPNCRQIISTNRVLKLNHDTVENEPIELYCPTQKSAKIEALLKHLKVIQDQSAGEQIVIFSQFSSYLDILEQDLNEALSTKETIIYKFDGRLSLKERSTVLKEFTTKDLTKQKILLLSLKAGGVGLNLTCSSHAFMMDPWWSPSMEDQAIDRIHRIGQSSNVKVVRFIVQGSIEEKMLKIQERKRTIGEAMDVDEDDRRKRRIEDIKMLFE